jgi:hypothetical protein
MLRSSYRGTSREGKEKSVESHGERMWKRTTMADEDP